MTSIDLVTFPGSRLAVAQPNPSIAQHGGGRLADRHDGGGQVGGASPPAGAAAPGGGEGVLWGLTSVQRGVCEAEAMNSIQIADETFVAADGARVAAAVADQSSWRRWWPDLQLRVVEDRAEKGIRWTVTGALTGTMEIWLEPSLDGVVLHYFLHAEPTGLAAWQLAKLNLAKMTHRRRVAGKKMAFEVKMTLERSRPVGVSPVV